MDGNPFQYGLIADSAAFADRERELQALTSDIRNGQDVVVLGRRRFGKSSLLFRAADRLRRQGVLIAYVDVMAAPTKDRLASALAQTIHAGIATPLMRARRRALAVFRDLRVQPTVTLKPDDASVSFTFAAGHDQEAVDATIVDLLELAGRLGAERDRRVALVFDEFQEIVDLDPHYPRVFRSIFQHQRGVSHVYLGSKRHLMDRLFNDRNEPFWRSAKQIELGPIGAEHFAPFVRRRLVDTDRAIQDGTLERLLELTAGHPYATQQLCYFLWEELPEGFTAGPPDLERALRGVLAAENAHFDLVWEQATRNERQLLLALGREPGRPYTVEYRRRHGLTSASHVQRSLRSLQRRELVRRREDDLYELAEPFLPAWLERLR
jgi:AAA+ ATPase superfamily predicted ATPase